MCTVSHDLQPSEPLSPVAGEEGGRAGGGFAEDLLARMERSIATTGGSIDQLKASSAHCTGLGWFWVGMRSSPSRIEEADSCVRWSMPSSS